MNKITILFVIVFAVSFTNTASTQTQNVDYALTGVKDSFYLDEIVSVVDTLTGKTVSVSKSSELFRSKEQVQAKVQYLINLKEQVKKQESEVIKEAEEKAKKIIEDAREQAKKLREYSPKLSQAAVKIQEAITQDKNCVFSQKKPDGKTGKKKKNPFTKN